MSFALPKVFWPLAITTANQAVYFSQSGTDYTANIAPATYYSAADLVTAVVAAMNAVGGHAGTFSASVSATGVLTIANASAFILRWTFTTSSAASLLGYTDGTDTSSATSQVAAAGLSHGWWSPLAPQTDSQTFYETPDTQVTMAVGGQNRTLEETDFGRRDIVFNWLPQANAITDGLSGMAVRTAIESWWRFGKGRFRYWPDATVEGTSIDYFLDSETVLNGMAITRTTPSKAIYSAKVRMRVFQA